MKKTSILLLVLLSVSMAQSQDLKTHLDSLSYGVGVMWAQNLRQQGLTELNPAILSKAIADALRGAEVMDMKTANTLLRQHQAEQKEAQKMKNIEEGRKFLQENQARRGVVTLPSGLQYEVLKEGDGPMPKSSDKVKVHYHGTLINGQIFDSSVQRGEPAVFGVTQVIKGWVEALQLMKVGSKWKLFIPADLAYGDRGAGAMIGPYATLIFEVELLGIE